eukprot:10264304-Karenia_brevis.AAC.1
MKVPREKELGDEYVRPVCEVASSREPQVRWLILNITVCKLKVSGQVSPSMGICSGGVLTCDQYAHDKCMLAQVDPAGGIASVPVEKGSGLGPRNPSRTVHHHTE